MYYSRITVFKETHNIAKISLCFVFSCVKMPTVTSDVRLPVLVNIKNFVSIVQYLMLFSLNTSF